MRTDGIKLFDYVFHYRLAQVTDTRDHVPGKDYLLRTDSDMLYKYSKFMYQVNEQLNVNWF